MFKVKFPGKISLSVTMFFAGLILFAAAAFAETLNGAGATFPYPVYSQWSYKYNKTTGVQINYQSIGSGGGIAQIKAKTVDFGATDAPLTEQELNESGLVQFPMIMGGVVAVINVPGIKENTVKLSPDVLSGIFLGKITKWNAPEILALNKGLKLPDKSISVVHRADGSGTTWIFTNYLEKVSKDWATKVGSGKAVSWPAGVGGKGNEGVAAYVQRISGSIGYVEYAYALQNKMTTVMLQNKAGGFVSPTIESFQEAAKNADWANSPGFYMVLTDQPGAKSWPITGASFILIYKSQSDPAKAKTMLEFFDWCFNHGGEIAKTLNYVPMPASVVTLIKNTWKEQVKTANGQPVLK